MIWHALEGIEFGLKSHSKPQLLSETLTTSILAVSSIMKIDYIGMLFLICVIQTLIGSSHVLANGMYIAIKLFFLDSFEISYCICEDNFS